MPTVTFCPPAPSASSAQRARTATRGRGFKSRHGQALHPALTPRARWPRRPTAIGTLVPAPKSLAVHVRERTFRARRHHELLTGPVLPWPALAELQGRYAASEHELERRAIAVEFERAVRDGIGADSNDSAGITSDLRAILSAPPVWIDDTDSSRHSARFRRAFLAFAHHHCGATVEAIAERLGVTPRTVRGYLAELGTRRRAPRPRRPARRAPRGSAVRSAPTTDEDDHPRRRARVAADPGRDP